MRTNKRAVGIIVKDQKILVFERYRYGQHYFAFPGGGVETEDENEEEAMKREIKEELSLDVIKSQFLFMVETQNDQGYFPRSDQDPNQNNKYCPFQYFYFVTDFSGVPELGGSEKERNCKDNQYIITWLPIHDLAKYERLYPLEGRARIIELINAGMIK